MIDLKSIDLESFSVKEGEIRGRKVYLINPRDFDVKWIKDNLYFRSLMVDENGEILSRGFSKFFNYLEKPELYPNPENFLRIFYGQFVPDSIDKPSYPNAVRYRNAAFDSLIEKGFETKNPTDGFEDYKNAEQLLLNDAPVIILWYSENMKVIHSFVKNFYFNPMNYKDFSETYIQKNSSSAAKP